MKTSTFVINWLILPNGKRTAIFLTSTEDSTYESETRLTSEPCCFRYKNELLLVIPLECNSTEFSELKPDTVYSYQPVAPFKFSA